MAEKLLMTALSPTMERGLITQWDKSEGDAIKNGDVICEVETDKAVMEYEADFDAVMLKIVVAEGKGAAIGEVIAIYGEVGEDYSDLITENVTPVYEKLPELSEKTVTAVADDTIKQDNTVGRRIKSSPLARKMAADLEISLETIAGSGYDGRIIKRDIQNAAEAGTPLDVPETVAPKNDIYKPVGAMRATIAGRLTASKFTAPHYYLTIQADMTRLQASKQDLFDRRKEKISVNSFLIKLVAAALRKHPVVNSSWEDNQIRAFNSADIGFAVALSDGLIAPVIRNCETKGIMQIDKEFRLLAGKAQTGALLPAEYSSAGFSISNLGSFGIEEFTAIINPPGSAILAVGATIKQTIVETADDGSDVIVIKPMMKMTLSCDHRVIDGAVGAAFLSDLKRMIEDPMEALL